MHDIYTKISKEKETLETDKTISKLKKADGLVVGSALCKEISKSIEKGHNPVKNVTNIVKKCVKYNAKKMCSI